MLFLVAEGTRYTSTLQLIGMVVVFIIVVAACYFVTRFVGAKQLAQQKNSNFLVLDTFRLTQNKYLQIIQIGKRYFVIALSKENISMVSELEKEDITWWRESAPGVASFQGILSALKKKQTEPLDGETKKEVKVDTHEE